MRARVLAAAVLVTALATLLIGTAGAAGASATVDVPGTTGFWSSIDPGNVTPPVDAGIDVTGLASVSLSASGGEVPFAGATNYADGCCFIAQWLDAANNPIALPADYCPVRVVDTGGASYANTYGSVPTSYFYPFGTPHGNNGVDAGTGLSPTPSTAIAVPPGAARLLFANLDSGYSDNSGDTYVTTTGSTTPVNCAGEPTKPLQTLTITGGNGTPGTPDASTDWSQDPVAWNSGISTTGAWHFTGNPNPVWHPAYLVGSHPWGLVPGTNSWINCGPTNASIQCGNASGTVVAFRVRFDLPAGSENPDVTFWIDSDNAGTYYINGVQVTDRLVGGPGTGANPVPTSAPGVPGVRTAALQGALHEGTNEMLVVVEDWGGLAGFNYKAQITVNADAPPVIIPPTPTDSAPPVDAPVATPAANGNGWNNSDVSVAWNWTDADSGIDTASCTQSSSSSGEGTHTLTSTCKDLAGNSASDTYTVNVDKTAPVDAPVLTPAPNGAGWNNSDVTVDWNWTDGGSGIDTTNCTQSSSSSGEGTQTLTSTCTDLAGNSATDSVTVNIDETAPTLAPSVSPSPVALNGSATASPNAADSGSGIASASCGPVDTSQYGSFTVTCTATDDAGNTASATASYDVTARATKQSVLAQIQAAAGSASKEDREALREAAKSLSASLSPSLWTDGNRAASKRVFELEKEAVEKLGELLHRKRSSIADATVQGWTDALVGDDRSLASFAIADAAGGDAKKLAQAQKELAKGDFEAAHGRPNAAIEHYGNAWQQAQQSGASHGHDHGGGDD